MERRRKSCSDKDGGVLVRSDFSGGWLVESSQDVKPRQQGASFPAAAAAASSPSSSSPVDDLKLFVGTWNVGGRAPHGELHLRDWLMSTPLPADIFILGFQEIVRLNAGNVLGAEDKGPARTWLALIRQALNSNKAGPPTATVSTQKPRVSVSDILSMEDGEDDAGNDGPSAIDLDFSGGDKSPPDSSPTTSRGSAYCLVASKQMVGVFLCVWARAGLMERIADLKVSCVGRGIMGYLGNKGSISISMTLQETTFCFVCTHLASGEKDGDEVRRNADVMEIMKRTRFPQCSRFLEPAARCSPETILEHDKIIWLGDLNYRLAATCSDTHELVQKNDWQALLEKDQLRIEQSAGRVFSGWEEGLIHFPPTYKFLANSDVYAVKPTKPKEKRRTPAWCDRILWRGNGMQQMCYNRGESQFSDHRPVHSLFSVQMVEHLRCVAAAHEAGKEDKLFAKNHNSSSSSCCCSSSSSWARVQAEELLLIARTQSCIEAARI
ncbi:type I inositol polyphosphate 5-phosphatase 8 isoform X1 [Canna indica]|uniref:Type I inositol polyphosphate 5-phosphatase 8 isoform X1 n=1 Tax=Canna indica TaxID=4628 RepID=A0AAQ3QAI7_9LILI|nr:type I inositol polyphosphate 5-phosphatase 8 isoform X1 [Canna indica]